MKKRESNLITILKIGVWFLLTPHYGLAVNVLGFNGRWKAKDCYQSLMYDICNYSTTVKWTLESKQMTEADLRVA